MATAKKTAPKPKAAATKVNDAKPKAAPKAPKAAPIPKATFPLHEAVALVVKKHETQADAAREFGIGKAYLSRLISGVKENPSEDVLERMGIRRHATVEYSLIRARPAGQPA